MKKLPKNHARTEHIPHIRIEPALRVALDQYVADNKTTVSSAVHDIVAAALIQAGYLIVRYQQVKPPVEEKEYVLVKPPGGWISSGFKPVKSPE